MDSSDTNDEPAQSSNRGLGLVESSIAGVQSAFANVYTTLHTTLEQSVQMTQTMNAMLVQMFKSNVKIASRLEHKDGTLLTVIVTNATQFPVLDIKANLAFEKTEDDIISGLDAVPDTPTEMAWSFKSASHASLGTGTRESAPSLFGSETFTLAPLTRHTEVQHISSQQATQCNGKITLWFANPSGGNPIQLEHNFGLYLIDQLSKKTQPLDWLDEQGVERRFEALFFREIMEIPAVIGIERGTCVQLDHKGASEKQSETTVVCRVVDILEEGRRVEARFYGVGQGTTLVNRLVSELDTLANT